MFSIPQMAEADQPKNIFNIPDLVRYYPVLASRIVRTEQPTDLLTPDLAVREVFSSLCVGLNRAVAGLKADNSTTAHKGDALWLHRISKIVGTGRVLRGTFSFEGGASLLDLQPEVYALGITKGSIGEQTNILVALVSPQRDMLSNHSGTVVLVRKAENDPSGKLFAIKALYTNSQKTTSVAICDFLHNPTDTMPLIETEGSSPLTLGAEIINYFK